MSTCADSYGLQLVTAPTAEPITLPEAKLHLRVEITDDDALIAGLVRAARQYCEDFTERRFVTQSLRMTLDSFPDCGCPIRLPRSPVQSITSIIYDDSNGVAQTLATDQYRLDATQEPARVEPAYGVWTWPTTRCQMGAVRVLFVAGYGGAADVPEGIKAAMKLLIGTWYTRRESVQEVLLRPVPLAVESLLWQYRTGGYV